MRATDFTVGWVCALPHELTASRAMLDEEYPPAQGRRQIHDDNSYIRGEIAGHKVVMACLPAGNYGLEAGTRAAKDMLRTYTSISFGLMVGIGGGIPTKKNDIRLGDVVVSRPTGDHGGVIQYDLGKMQSDGTFKRKGTLNKPPLILLNALQNLQSTHELGGSKIYENLQRLTEKSPYLGAEYRRPDSTDTLYASECNHSPATRCDQCGSHIQVPRTPRTDTQPHIHYGLIGSGNRVIASSAERDWLRSKESEEILCLEMEAAGLMDQLPCLVIRGICDYADSHKRDEWQKYAATTAAAYAREVLQTVERFETSRNVQAQVGQVRQQYNGM